VSEREEQAAIVRLLRTIGATVYVLGTVRRQGDYQGTMQTPGVPDLYAFLPARPIGRPRQLWIEVKTKTGRRSNPQRLFAELAEVGLVDYVCGPLDAVIAWLTEHKYLREN
jgi:hypothetical protein